MKSGAWIIPSFSSSSFGISAAQSVTIFILIFLY
jgi:hypothetical protein